MASCCAACCCVPPQPSPASVAKAPEQKPLHEHVRHADEPLHGVRHLIQMWVHTWPNGGGMVPSVQENTLHAPAYAASESFNRFPPMHLSYKRRQSHDCPSLIRRLDPRLHVLVSGQCISVFLDLSRATLHVLRAMGGGRQLIHTAAPLGQVVHGGTILRLLKLPLDSNDARAWRRVTSPLQ